MTTPSVPPQPIVSVEQLLAESEEIAALPQVVMRVIDLTVDPKATATDLERVVGTDQALAGKILALANSSYYGLPRRISSLREAIVFLGFKAIRNLAMTVTTFNLFLGKSDAESLVRRELWRHSVDTAQCARLIGTRLHAADRESFGTDEAFTCGLLHDVGKLILDRSRHALFATLMETASAHNMRFYEIELQAMPWNHAEIGMALAARWNLPLPVCETIGFHHTPRAASINPRLTATVSLANEFAHYLTESALGNAQQSVKIWADTVCRSEPMLLALRLTPEKAQCIASECRSEVDKGLATQMMPV
jgi:HD-like signal output (HDOD) protein